jgi:hypothetical protein
MWEELGIPPTDDLKAIRKAYAARLRIVGKSGDRIAFQRLRAAYERAILFAQGHRQPQLATCGPAPTVLRPSETTEVKHVAQEEIPGDELAQIQSAVAAHNTELAVTLYERGLAQGTLPLGKHHAVLDHIMSGPVNDLSLDQAGYMALVKRVGWDNAQIGWPISPVHSAAMSRLEAEKWLKHLSETERGAKSIWSLLWATRVDQWIRVLMRRRWERRNARLLLVDWPQLPRISLRSVADLRALVTQFHHYEKWLKGRITEHAVERADRLLILDQRWGNLLRRLFLIAIIVTPMLLLATIGADHAEFAGKLIFIFVSGLMSLGMLRWMKILFIRVKKLLSA